MKCLVHLAFVGMLLTPAIGRGQTLCPWLNRATAASLLAAGDDIKAQNRITEAAPCFFSYRHENAVYSLRITVQEGSDEDMGATALKSGCASQRTPLNSIGNEALLCDSDIGTLHGEEVAGRVRDRTFLVQIMSSTNRAGPTNRKILREAAIRAAEQVAGNLF